MPALFVLLLALLSACLLSLRLRVVRARRVLGVLHPYANDGGGGERVLWVALRELLARHQLQGWRVVVYTGDAASDDEIRAATLSRFGVDVPESVEFVRLRSRRVVEPSSYPVATLLGQAVGSLLLLLEALARAPPSVLLDTTGYGYCYAAAKALGVRRVGCYVHYPILSSEMARDDAR